MKCQILFSIKNKKNITNLSSAKSAQSVVSVKLMLASNLPSGPFLLWKTFPAPSVAGGAMGTEFLFSVRGPGFGPAIPDSSWSFGGGAAIVLSSSVASLFTHCFLASSHII